MHITFVWWYVPWFHSYMDCQRHLLGYHGQLFLHSWQTWFGACLVGRGCWVRVTMIALESKSRVGIIPICVSSEVHTMPYCTIFSQLPTSACASRHAPCVPCWIAFYNHSSSSIMPVNNHSINNSLTGRCRLASGRWGRLVGLLYGCTKRHDFGLK